MSFKGSSIFSSGGHSVQWSETIFSNFDRGSPKQHFCEIFFKSYHWPMRCRLKVCLFLAPVLVPGKE